jgi:hypothetical protein
MFRSGPPGQLHFSATPPFRQFPGRRPAAFFRITEWTITPLPACPCWAWILSPPSHWKRLLRDNSAGCGPKALRQGVHSSGINEIGCATDYFKDAYGTMLDSVRASQPDATFISCPHAGHAIINRATSDTFNMTRIKRV